MLKKDYFFFSWIPPAPPIQCWDIKQQLRTKTILVLSNIDPGAGGTSTKKVKIGNIPNIFDDDCRS